MTQAVDSMRVEPGLPARGQPFVPDWVIPRTRLADRLDRGVAGPVTLVTGPSGWGKTLGVASWAASTQDRGHPTWLSAAGAAADPDLFLDLLHTSLVEGGARQLAPVPSFGLPQRTRTRALAMLGASLRRSGPWVVVLDDYPTGDVGPLGADLEVVLHHAQRGLSLVLISHGEPALGVQRHHVAGDLTRIAVPDLAMDWHEVAGVLARHDVDARELTARMVERHTAGWACGVRLAALALRGVPTIEAAMAEADRATVDFLAAEVLGKTPPPARELLVRTSMVADVSQDLARSVLGPDADVVITPEIASEASVELRSDGSFTCPPLLRAAALAELAREPVQVSREATRRAAQWHLDHDRATTGLEIAMTAGDWPWVGRALVESYAVPQILAGGVTATVESALAIAPVRAAEPLIEAALLLRRGGPDATERVLAVMGESGAGGQTPADELSAIFVRLAVARARGDVDTGLLLATRARDLLPHLRIERQRALVTILEAHVGALAVTNGELARAEVTLRHGAGEALVDSRTSPAPLDCLGQLALLDAFRDNLRAAERQAAAVLKSPGQGQWMGTAHAHLATAWVHVERDEPGPARQHLDRAAEAAGDGAEPWYHTAQLLAETRLLVATDQPEAALRLLGPALEAANQQERSEWRVALLTVATAQALVATGEPRRALELVDPGPVATPFTNHVVAARALLSLGDLAGARTALAGAAPDLPSVPLGVQVECWVLDARLSEEADSAERARLLVDRALRVAGRELLRRPFAHESSWLLPVVERDPKLRRAHGGFLARLTAPSAGHSARGSEPPWSGQLVVETLTVREAEVLGLLAEMCSTEEIARELFLSVNTVKTYVRGILRKLSVNRRVDAVRRGRELGLC